MNFSSEQKAPKQFEFLNRMLTIPFHLEICNSNTTFQVYMLTHGSATTEVDSFPPAEKDPPDFRRFRGPRSVWREELVGPRLSKGPFRAG